MAFVASGFEHSVANMYLIPIGILLKNSAEVVAAAGLSGKLANLTWGGFITRNLIPVTLGNIIGGAFFVATLYWVVYLKGKK
jgi:formate/nitrite transporter FocA (FNT family)